MPSHAGAEGHNLTSFNKYKLDDRSIFVDWSAYAVAYDLLSAHNPEYQALMHEFEAFLATISTPKTIYDIGGGTGNYTEIAARNFPGSQLHLVEPDAGMIGLARAKLADYGNITYHRIPIEGVTASDKADLVICVHALYAMPAHEERLRDLHRLLRPGGLLYLVDLGRYMNVADWRSYLFSNLIKERGLIFALRLLWRGREIAKQNKAILKAQKDGVYWTHTAEEIASAVTSAGFTIARQKSVYRGYSDLLVCKAMP